MRCKREGKSEVILFNLCGHGRFDMSAYMDYAYARLTDQFLRRGRLAMALAGSGCLCPPDDLSD